MALGTYSLISIPKESSPEVVIPVGVISTVYPGAPASAVESLVTNEIERGLTTLENVKTITSTSRENLSTVIVEFTADADVEDSISDLKDTVDVIKADLPSDADNPVVSEVDFVNQPILTLALSGDLSDRELTFLAEQVETELEKVPGVSRIEIDGVSKRQVTILVDQASLARFNITLSEIVGALQKANQTIPLGQVSINNTNYNIAFEGDIVDTGAVLDVPVAVRNGQPVLVRDLAVVEDGLMPANALSRLSDDGQPSSKSFTVNVYKKSGGDVTKITGSVRNKVEEMKVSGGLLSGINAVTILDYGELISDDLNNLTISGIQTVVLVVLLLVFAIGWREGLLAGLAIPLSFLFGFIGLYFSGNTINFLSLFSLILGIGILVDSAIVMVEGINRKMKANPTIDKKQASIESINEFAIPLISGTLTTVAMFAGLFVVSGVTGQFIASIPFTLIFLLFSSLFVAMAIIPLLATVILHRHTHGNFEAKQLLYAQRLESWYKELLRKIITDKDKQRVFLALIFSGLILSISFTFNLAFGLIASILTYLFARLLDRNQGRKKYGRGKRALLWYPGLVCILLLSFFVSNSFLPTVHPVQVTFFEQSDVDYLIAEIEFPEGTTKEITDIGARRFEEILYREKDIESFTVTVGRGSSFGSGGSDEKLANFFINLRSDRERNSTEILEHLQSQVRDIYDFKVSIIQPSEGPPTGSAITVKFLGEDLSELTRIGNEASSILRATTGAVNVKASTNSNSTELVLQLDRLRASSLGVDPLTVSSMARTAIYGTEATSINTLNSDTSIVVRLNVTGNDSVTAETANQITVEALREIIIMTNSGPVPLSELVDITLRESQSVIEHENGMRVVSVTADISAGSNAREVQAEFIKSINEQIDMPTGITLSTTGGETEDSNRAFVEMFIALVVGVLLMLGVLILQFNSFLHTYYVLSILPYSLIGIMFGLAVTANPLSFPSIMGFIALSGIVVNNAIILIDKMNSQRKANPQSSISEIVMDASASRVRPILLTATTTVIGMLPLAYAGDLWAPLAFAVMFGLIFSVIITLILIPILYVRRPE